MKQVTYPGALSHDLPPTSPSWTRSSLNMTHPETAKLDANNRGAIRLADDLQPAGVLAPHYLH